jgi:predicted phage terminase large subunit-like protein
VGVSNRQNKVVRIRRLGTYLHRRQVRFRSTPGSRMLVDQLRDFPEAAHDDGPDALELAVRRPEVLTDPGRG